MKETPQKTDADETLAAQLKIATELLEKAAIDRVVLTKLSTEERARLFTAARTIFSPDVTERRRLVKAKRVDRPL